MRRRVSVGAVPGYARFDAPSELTLLHTIPFGLTLQSVELFMQRRRARWVVRVAGAVAWSPDARRALMTWMREVARRANAQVFALEVSETPERPATGLLLLARDGRGWTGLESQVFGMVDVPGEVPFLIQALEGTPSQPGQGWYVPSLPGEAVASTRMTSSTEGASNAG